MNGRRVRALFRKEMLDLRRNPGALAPVLIGTALTLVLPFGIVLAVPAITGVQLANDADLARVSELSVSGQNLSGEARIQLFLFEQFLVLSLLTPVTGGMALAAHSVVGEKAGRTLEPLLATPVSTLELLVAKVLGAFIPAMVMTMSAVALYFAGIILLAAPGVAGGMVTWRSAALVFLAAPGAALVALQGALIVSSRVNDPRAAQQFGVFIILPLIGILVAQFAGALQLSARGVAAGGLMMLGLWALLALIGAGIFRREAILIRWR